MKDKNSKKVKLARGCEKLLGKKTVPFIRCSACSYLYNDKNCKDFREEYGTKVVNR